WRRSSSRSVLLIGRFSYGAAIFASSASLTAVLPLILNLRTATRGVNGTRPVSGGGSGGNSRISGAGLRNCGAGSGLSEGSVSGGSGADGGGGAWPQAKLTAASRPRPASARNRRDGRKRAPAQARQQLCSAGNRRPPAARRRGQRARTSSARLRVAPNTRRARAGSHRQRHAAIV